MTFIINYALIQFNNFYQKRGPKDEEKTFKRDFC